MTKRWSRKGVCRAQAEVTGRELAPFRNTWHERERERERGRGAGRSVRSTCGLDKSISPSRVKQEPSPGWEAARRLILHFRPHSPRLLTQACKSSICFWLSVTLSFYNTHIPPLYCTLPPPSPCTRWHAPVLPSGTKERIFRSSSPATNVGISYRGARESKPADANVPLS